jgi:hypothetical protein
VGFSRARGRGHRIPSSLFIVDEQPYEPLGHRTSELTVPEQLQTGTASPVQQFGIGEMRVDRGYPRGRHGAGIARWDQRSVHAVVYDFSAPLRVGG